MTRELTTGTADLFFRAVESSLIQTGQPMDSLPKNWEQIVGKEFEEIPKDKYPRVILVIMDGNRRKARSLGLRDSIGHVLGTDNGIKLIEDNAKRGVDSIWWGASVKNIRERSQDELDTINDQIVSKGGKLVAKLHKNQARFIHLGRTNPLIDQITGEVIIKGLPEKVKESFQKWEELTHDNRGPVITLAYNYDGRDELGRAYGKYVTHTREHGDIPVLPEYLPYDDPRLVPFLDDGGRLGKINIVYRTGIEPHELPYLSGFGFRAEDARIISFPFGFPDLKTEHIKLGFVLYSRIQKRNGK